MKRRKTQTYIAVELRRMIWANPTNCLDCKKRVIVTTKNQNG